MAEIREYRSTDSIDEITNLLHNAYGALLKLGFRYVATHQTPEITRERIARGTCYIAQQDGRIIGTICLYRNSDGSSKHYATPGVFHFGQFAVEPTCQGQGIGRALLAHVEEQAKMQGATHLALDTAEGATHLVNFYSRHGFSVVEQVDWSETNYLSVIMSKPLP